MTDVKRFRSICRWLRRHFPSCFPVEYRLRPLDNIRRINPEAAKGVCEVFDDDSHLSPNSFRVTVLSTLSEEETIQTIFHEHAHVLRSHIRHFGDINADDPIRALIEDSIWRRWHEEE